ncbi:uncharacterized protein EDB91DRAFT_1347532 [Suillus paluster]|uniref:uncharacterized protein n=1 Tax=Suillus paluster TaxID=48578 RepID=UPI001B87BE0A|nr:uncharacterized protein EDB91DRAFT_1347532 [Suillus paluster]KAG1738921.1 hypothetical protein EDB91DRAFT_1347532 [Suillus paluster]
MAKGKKGNSKKLTIKLPPIQPGHRHDDANELDELLEFPESPLLTVEGSKMTGHLSKVQWPAGDAEDQLDEDDDWEVEVDELELESDESVECIHQSTDRSSTSAAAVSPTLKFVYTNPASFGASHKRKQPVDHVSSPKAAVKKRKLSGIPLDSDKVINRQPLRKSKKASARGKKVCRESIFDSLTQSEDSEGMADEDAPRKFTVYVQVWSASTETQKKTGKAVKAPPLAVTVTRGPFKLDTAQTFLTFKQEVAKALPCRLTMLPVTKFEWKFENQAQSAPRKKIADQAGYEALVDAVSAKWTTDNVVVWLYTPKPAKEEEDWDTGKPDFIEHPFDFDDEAAQGGSAKGVIEDIAARRVTAEAELQDLYPFVWATAIVAGKANKTAPPTSAHFTADKKLKVLASVRPPPGAPLSAFGEFYHQRQEEHASLTPHTQAPNPELLHSIPAPAPGFPPYVPHQPYGFHPGPYYPPYMQPPYAGGFGYPAQPYYSGHGQPVGGHPPFGTPGETSASSSPSVTTTHNVSLSEFCVKYHISDSDQAKLMALEYQPGNRAVETLEEKEWRDIGQFTKLGWQAFLGAHRKFCTTIKSGTWLQ